MPADIAQFPVHALRRVTARQFEVVSGLLEGQTVRDLAVSMDISESTARKHIRGLHETAGTHNLHGLVVWAIAHWTCCVLLGQRRAMSQIRQAIRSDVVAAGS